jgi:hypothetical protein
VPSPPDPEAVVAALRRGPATLDALSVRLGGAPRDDLAWALEDARARGWVSSSADAECGPDGICSTGAPVVYRALVSPPPR